MNDRTSKCVLGTNDLPPAAIRNPNGSSRFLFIGDHAGRAIPISLGTLGLDPAALGQHIAVDLGTAELGERLATMLDATFLSHRYSRLVVDCNRNPDVTEAIPEESDGTAVPGNVRLSPAARAARVAEIHEPYQAAIAAELARRDEAGAQVILVSLHSFTPRLGDGAERPWHVGVLHDGGRTDFAKATLAALAARGDLVVGDNEPYRMDETDHTVPRHAYAAARPYLEIEIRQDGLTAPGGCARWSEVMADVLGAAARSLGLPTRSG